MTPPHNVQNRIPMLTCEPAHRAPDHGANHAQRTPCDLELQRRKLARCHMLLTLLDTSTQLRIKGWCLSSCTACGACVEGPWQLLLCCTTLWRPYCPAAAVVLATTVAAAGPGFPFTVVASTAAFAGVASAVGVALLAGKPLHAGAAAQRVQCAKGRHSAATICADASAYFWGSSNTAAASSTAGRSTALSSLLGSGPASMCASRCAHSSALAGVHARQCEIDSGSDSDSALACV
eukprot:1157620-Pelagomonas_calceolata.AAC.3